MFDISNQLLTGHLPFVLLCQVDEGTFSYLTIHHECLVICVDQSSKVFNVLRMPGFVLTTIY